MPDMRGKVLTTLHYVSVGANENGVWDSREERVMFVLAHVHPEKKLAGLPSMRYYDLRRAAAPLIAA